MIDLYWLPLRFWKIPRFYLHMFRSCWKFHRTNLDYLVSKKDLKRNISYEQAVKPKMYQRFLNMGNNMGGTFGEHLDYSVSKIQTGPLNMYAIFDLLRRREWISDNEYAMP